MTSHEQGTDVPSPRTRAWGAAGVWLEAAALGVACVAYAIHAFSLPEPAFAVGLAAFAGLIGAGLAVTGRGLRRGARWAVSAALTWQALQILAGANLVGVRPWLGVPAVAVGVVVGLAVVVGSRDTLRSR